MYLHIRPVYGMSNWAAYHMYGIEFSDTSTYVINNLYIYWIKREIETWNGLISVFSIVLVKGAKKPFDKPVSDRDHEVLGMGSF
jgi:hypothetical protein